MLQGDIFETLPRLEPDIVTANLFLHHLDDAALTRLLALMAARAKGFVACEPRRRALRCWARALVFVLGANDVTRHDAVASVRAGFRGRELSALWPQERRWQSERARVLPFTHVFPAPMLFDAVDHRRRARRLGGGAAAGAGRLGGRAGGEGGISPPQGVRRIHLRRHHAGAGSLRRRPSAFLAAAGPPVTRVGVYAGDAMLTAPRGKSLGPGAGARASGYDAARCGGGGGRQAVSARRSLTALRARGGRLCICRLDDGRQARRRRIVIAACGSWNAKGLFALTTPNPRHPTCSPSRRISGTARLPAGLMPLLAFPGGYGGMVQTMAAARRCPAASAATRWRTLAPRHGGKAAEAVLAPHHGHHQGRA